MPPFYSEGTWPQKDTTIHALEPLPHGLLVLLALLVRSPNRKDEKSEKRNGLEISTRCRHPAGQAPHRRSFGLKLAPLHVSRDPLRGNLFENLVVADAMKARLNRGKDPRLFFLRTEKGFEVDLIVREGRALRPVEIKSAATFHPDFVSRLKRFCAEEPDAATPLLVYDGEGYADRSGVKCANFREDPFEERE